MAIFNVSELHEMVDAVGRASGGDEIMIATGTYANWRLDILCSGLVSAPLVVRPESDHSVTFTGETTLQITGQYVEVQGFRFETCGLSFPCVDLDGARNCRVTNCWFEDCVGRAPVLGIRGSALDNRIDHCTFLRPEARSVRVEVQSEDAPMRNQIDHNLFQDVPPIGGNGRETIQVGQKQPVWGLVEAQTVVEYNTFLRCNGEAEVIRNKSSRNIYRHNLFKDCEGELVMRGGSYCTIENNRFEGCSGGIRLSGTHHQVVNNVVANNRNTGIRILYGMSLNLGGHYQAAGHCLIANNTIVNAGQIGIYIGSGGGKDWGEKGVADEAPYENRFVNNIVTGVSGQLLLVEGRENTIENNLLYATEGATVSESGIHVIQKDPKFVDPSQGDFRLSPGSPGVGAGVPVAGGHTAHIGASCVPFETGPDSVP